MRVRSGPIDESEVDLTQDIGSRRSLHGAMSSASIVQAAAVAMQMRSAVHDSEEDEG